ncbi:hypothetical protein Plhal703r1_c26g0107821 [Plasmopara halstedii]
MDSAERLTTKMRKLKAFSTKGPLLERSEAEEKEVTTIRQTEETSAKQSITVKQAIKTGSKSDGLHNSVGGKVNFGRANSNATQQQRKRSASLGTKPRTQISSRPHSSQSTGNNPSMGKNDDSRATKASLGLNGKPKSEKTSKTQRKKKAEARKKQEDLVNTMRYGSLIDDKVKEGEKGPITDSEVDETLPAKLVEAETTAKHLAKEAAEALSKNKEAKEKAEEAAAGFVATAGAVHTAAIVNGLQQQGKGKQRGDALREQLEQLALKRQEMAEQAKAAHRAFQIAKAKALKVQKVLNKHQAGASKYQTPNEDDRGAKGEPPVHDTGLIAQEEVIKEKAATVARDVHLFDAFTVQRRENHGGDDMSARNDVDMGASLRLDDLDENTLLSLPIPRGIWNATEGFTLNGLHKQEPKFSDTLPKPMEEILREKPTCLEPILELQSVMKVAQAKSEEAKNIRQGQRYRNDHGRTLGATGIRKARLDQPLTNKSRKRETKHREIHSLKVIDVPEIGNCLSSALFAAVSGFSGSGKIEYSDGEEKEAQVWKERILAVCQEYVMLEGEGGVMRLPNLRQRLKELYLSEEWVMSEDPTQIMNRLIRHYAESRDIQVRDLVPYVFWGRAAELHAAVGLLREPIYVIEADDTGHIQDRRYCYQNKTGVYGIQSEMGCDFIMTIPELNKFMRTARQHRVLPTMLLYRRRRNGGDHFQALEFEDHLNQNFIVQETMDVHPKHARATG